ncbi:MAG TPA: hypothetical protein EYG57_18055 [Planctomycetes bacterium]|nr:hypothetical protein [Planctomycetaceae bacterium]HIM31437.1 hypothetical protein [Planctomycetota bacterium]
MKWNTLIGTMVLTIAICSQGFAAGLLDRMLGASGCGCDTKCCEASCGAEATCCDEAEPSCGCDDNGCDAAPDCGCDAKKSCGRKGLLSGLLSCKKKSCCDDKGCDAAPDCGCDNDNGCDAAPDCGCDAKKSCCRNRGSLLERIFSCSRSKCGCDDACDAAPDCGCDNGCDAAPAEADAEPNPPAPIVDPSAAHTVNRRVVHASFSR